MNENENKEMQVISDTEQKATTVTVNSFFKKAAVVSKKVAVNVQEAASVTSEKIKEDSKNRRLKKYHPITLKEYKSKKFNIPNVIKIVDDAETRHIDVCKDAIGRLVNEKGVEIFYMTDEFVSTCGLHFVPAPVCDAIYHVDNFDRTRFIRTDEIFSKALEEKLAELEHIAFCLGARSCSIEIVEDNQENNERKTKSESSLKEDKKNGNKFKNTVSVESKNNTKRNNRGKSITNFSQNTIPQQPRLKWFAHNDNVRNLIEMRLAESGSVRSKTLELSGTSSASMTQKTAIAIDYEISKTGIKSNNNIERQAQIEKNSKLIFEVIFDE